MDSNQIEIEFEVNSDLLEKVSVAAKARGISVEQCIGEILQQYIEEHH